MRGPPFLAPSLQVALKELIIKPERGRNQRRHLSTASSAISFEILQAADTENSTDDFEDLEDEARISLCAPSSLPVYIFPRPEGENAMKQTFKWISLPHLSTVHFQVFFVVPKRPRRAR